MAGDHINDMLVLLVCSYTGKNASVNIMYVIYHKADMKHICGNIRNVFPNAYTNVKVFVKRSGK